MVGQAQLYDAVTEIAEDYFGPAANRVMSRLITSHLGKEPTQLRRRDLDELSRWAKLSAAMMTDNQAAVDEFAHRLSVLK